MMCIACQGTVNWRSQRVGIPEPNPSLHTTSPTVRIGVKSLLTAPDRRVSLLYGGWGNRWQTTRLQWD